jgi:phospholipase/lecithinase/hemolysin
MNAALPYLTASNDPNTASRIAGLISASVTTLFAFGDSITDTGNQFASTGSSSGLGLVPPGYVSNGPPFPLVLATWLGVPLTARLAPSSPIGTSYSYPGAVVQVTASTPGQPTHNLVDQVNLFLADTAGIAPLNAAAIVFIGSNDAFGTNGDMTTNVAQLAVLVQQILGTGIQSVVVCNLPIRSGPGNTGSQTYNTNAAFWNGLLAPAMAAIPGVVLFNLSAFMTTIFNNPNSFGFLNTQPQGNTGGAANSFLAFPDSYIYFSQGLHLSAGAHRLIAQQLLPVFQNTYGNSRQIDRAISNFGSGAFLANGPLPTAALYSQGTTGANPSAQITASDFRLLMAQAAILSPQNIIRVSCDFEAGPSQPPPYTWLTDIVATGAIGTTPAYGSQLAGSFGALPLTCTAVSDVAGQGIPSAIFPAMGSGMLDMTLRYAFNLVATDSQDLFFMLADSQSNHPPANSIGFFLANSNGSVTGCSVNAKQGGTSHQVVFGNIAPFSMVNNVFHTLRVITDPTCTMCQVYFDGNLINQGVIVPPTGALMPKFYATRVGGTTGGSTWYIDSFTINYLFPRP